MALGKPTKSFDEAKYRDDIDRLARQYLIYGKATSLGSALSAFLSAVFDNGLRLDSELTRAPDFVSPMAFSERCPRWELSSVNSSESSSARS